MLQRHLRYVACFVFCRSFNIAELISSCSLSLSLCLLGDCSSYQRLSGAAKGAWGHHFCPSWRPQLSGRSQSDGRSWYVVHSLCTDLYLDLLSVKACLECIFICKHLPIIIDFIWFSPLSSGKTTGIPIHVFGTETHMTAIVGMALGHRPIPNQPPVAAHTANFLLNSSGSTSVWHILTPQRQIGCRDLVSAHSAVNWHHQLHQ